MDVVIIKWPGQSVIIWNMERMMKTKKTLAKKRHVKRSSTGGNEVWNLRLYVAGQTPKSLTAIANLEKICEEHLEGRYKIELIDLLQSPQLAKGDQILALPTLVRKLPVPVRKIIGDLSDTDRVLVGLDLIPIRQEI